MNPMDIPQQGFILLLRLLWKLLIILGVLLVFLPNYLFFGWQRTWCSLIHHILLGYGVRDHFPDKYSSPDSVICLRCNLTYPVDRENPQSF